MPVVRMALLKHQERLNAVVLAFLEKLRIALATPSAGQRSQMNFGVFMNVISGSWWVASAV